MPKKKMVWTPARPVHRYYLKSSDFTGKKPFIPEYLLTPEVDFTKLMAMDYNRMWWDAVRIYRARTAGAAADNFFFRTYVKRIKHNILENPKTEMTFTMKKFKDVPARTKHFQGDKFDPKNPEPDAKKLDQNASTEGTK